MKIGILRAADSRFGGTRYEEMAGKALDGKHRVQRFDVSPWLPMGRRPQSMLRVALTERLAGVDLWIRPELAVSGMTRASSGAMNVAIAHHFGEPMGASQTWDRALHKLWLRNAQKCERVVVVAKYWYTFLEELGLTNLALIYNAFDVNRFSVSRDQVKHFREKYGLTGKPVVYVGNPQRRKGTRAAWTALRSAKYHFVTSGYSDTTLPIPTFYLKYDDYILLLASSDVVLTMSESQEGWNRTAHEAMLCRTPVVGSGIGGMKELLEGGEQLICDHNSKLSEYVEYAITHRNVLGARGYSFASKFTKERFERAWLSLCESL